MVRHRVPKKKRLTKQISLLLTESQFDGLERLVKIMRLRTKQQVLRQLLGKTMDVELGAW